MHCNLNDSVYAAFNTSAYGVTLMSLMNEIANNADERSLISSRSALWQNDSKFLYALTGTAILAFTIKLVGGETVGAYTILALAVSLFALLTCLVDYFITSGYEKVPEISTETASATQAKKKFFFGETIKVIFANGQLVIQPVVTFTMTFGNVLLSSMLMYYYTYVAENVALMSVHLLLSNIIAVVSNFVAPFLTGKISNKGISLVGLG